MANTRQTTILASKSIATAGVETIQLLEADPISQITIRQKGTNSSSTPTGVPALAIKTIELKDGSDVLYRASGIEGQAINFFETGNMPFNVMEYEDNIQCCATVNLNFGRWLWDEQYALDPKRHKNLTIDITHDKALGGSAPDAGTLLVSGKVFDEKRINPQGFLQTKEHYSYSLSASGIETIELPVDHPYRMLMVQAQGGLNINDQFSKVELYENSRAKTIIPYTSMSELMKSLHQDKRVIENLATLGTGSAVDHFISPAYESFGVGVGRSHSQTTAIVAQPAGSTMAITNDASESLAVQVQGYAPHGALEILEADPLNPANWYHANRVKNARLELTAGGSASGTGKVIIQQARSY